MKNFKKLMLTGFLSLNYVFTIQSTKAEGFDIQSCPTKSSGNASAAFIQEELEGNCLHTPDKFEIVIYEMGLCAPGQNPISDSGATLELDKCVSTMKSEGSTVDLAPGSGSEKTAALPQSTGRPPSNTYNFAYIILSKEIKMNGKYELSNDDICVSKQGEDPDGYLYGEFDCAVGAVQEDHIDDLNNMGGDTWSGYMPATDMPTGGSVEALLLKSDNTVALNKSEVSRLIGLFKTDDTNPVVITDSTSGLEMVLEVSVNEEGRGGSYLIVTNGDESGPYFEAFESAPFKPRFTTF